MKQSSTNNYNYLYFLLIIPIIIYLIIKKLKNKTTKTSDNKSSDLLSSSEHLNKTKNETSNKFNQKLSKSLVPHKLNTTKIIDNILGLIEEHESESEKLVTLLLQLEPNKNYIVPNVEMGHIKVGHELIKWHGEINDYINYNLSKIKKNIKDFQNFDKEIELLLNFKFKEVIIEFQKNTRDNIIMKFIKDITEIEYGALYENMYHISSIYLVQKIKQINKQINKNKL